MTSKDAPSSPSTSSGEERSAERMSRLALRKLTPSHRRQLALHLWAARKARSEEDRSGVYPSVVEVKGQFVRLIS